MVSAAAGQAVNVGQTVVDDGDDDEADLPAGAPTQQAAPRQQREQDRQPAKTSVAQDGAAASSGGDDPQPCCKVCRKVISPNVHDFSVRKYKAPLCIDHQREADARSNGQGGGQTRGGRGGGR